MVGPVVSHHTHIFVIIIRIRRNFHSHVFKGMSGKRNGMVSDHFDNCNLLLTGTFWLDRYDADMSQYEQVAPVLTFPIHFPIHVARIHSFVPHWFVLSAMDDTISTHISVLLYVDFTLASSFLSNKESVSFCAYSL